MARPKTKSALAEGFSDLMQTIRSIETKLEQLLKHKPTAAASAGPGRPKGKRGPGRPKSAVKSATPGAKRGPGRPPKNAAPAAAKSKTARPAGKRGRGRPKGSKTKK